MFAAHALFQTFSKLPVTVTYLIVAGGGGGAGAVGGAPDGKPAKTIAISKVLVN